MQIRRRLALARGIEQALQLVRSTFNSGKAQHARRALEAVGLAKQFFQQHGFAGRFFQAQQTLVQMGEVLFRLRLEQLEQFRVDVHDMKCLTTTLRQWLSDSRQLR